MKFTPTILLAGLAALASGCVTLPREDGTAIAPLNAHLEGFEREIRTIGIDKNAMADLRVRLAALKRSSDSTLDFLALSGGGAGGAYGAGIITGMTKAEKRPVFEVVTGVSTGALIAPFAFLGADWDDELERAFTSEDASHLLKDRGIGILFSASVFDGGPLLELVDNFVSVDMVNAIADQSEAGRLLIVATTDLDIQQPVYWDIGRIARHRTERARKLIRDVLIASASIPGVFDPMMIPVRTDTQTFEEMHVDGGTTIPFFLGPEIWSLSGEAVAVLNNANIYIIINGRLQSPASSTPVNTFQVVSRAFDTMMIYAARSALGEHVALAERQRMNLHVSFVPTDLAYKGALDFDMKDRHKLYFYGQTCAIRDELWFRREDLPEVLGNSRVLAKDLIQGYAVPDHCPRQKLDATVTAASG